MSIHNETRMSIFARRAFVGINWEKDVRVSIEAGAVTAIEAGSQAGVDDVRVDTLLPALANLHSHSFQRAMAVSKRIRDLNESLGGSRFGFSQSDNVTTVGRMTLVFQAVRSYS